MNNLLSLGRIDRSRLRRSWHWLAHGAVVPFGPWLVDAVAAPDSQSLY